MGVALERNGAAGNDMPLFTNEQDPQPQKRMDSILLDDIAA